MPTYIICTIEDVEKYTGKNGFGANITVSTLLDKKRKSLKFNITSAEYASLLEENLQEVVTLILTLDDNKFGLRIGSLLSVTKGSILDSLNKKVS